MIPLKLVPTTVEGLISEIRDGQLYSYARYGDGEWKSVLGDRGNNANEHDWTPELQADLTKALLSRPQYRLATVQRELDPILCPVYRLAWNWLAEHRLDFEWYDQEVFADSLLQATENKQVAPLVTFLRNRSSSVGSTLLVGPDYLRGLDDLFEVEGIVQTANRNCYPQKAEIEQGIIDMFCFMKHPVLCLISASMVAEAIIHDLYPLLGKQGWLIDVGSIWNPYLGKTNRSYWNKMGPAIV